MTFGRTTRYSPPARHWLVFSMMVWEAGSRSKKLRSVKVWRTLPAGSVTSGVSSAPPGRLVMNVRDHSDQV